MADTSATPVFGAARAKTFLFYGGMIAIATAVFLAIRVAGEGLGAPAPLGVHPPAAAQNIDTLFHALLALSVIVVVARVVGYLGGLIGQPMVVGEVVGGIILGPSLLGRIAPGAYGQFLPQSVGSFLGLYSQI